MLHVPSELPLITSRHWLTFAVESLKKLYNKTYIVLKSYDIARRVGPTSLNSRPLLSYNVLEWVLYRCEFALRWGSHDHAALSQFLLQSLPSIVVANKDTWIWPCE